MALGAAQTLALAGTTPSYATPGATENIPAVEGLILHVKNANASPCTVTIVDPGVTPAGSVATNPTVSVPATTGDKMIPLSTAFRNAGTGNIQVTFSVQTSVTGAVLRRG